MILNLAFVLAALKVAFGDNLDCSEPPEHTTLVNCCIKPSLFTKNILEKCSNYARERHQLEMRGFPQPCFAECAFQDIGLLNGNKILDFPAEMYLKKVLPQHYMSFLPVFRNSFEKCTEYFKKGYSNETHQNGNAHCRVVPGLLLVCINADSFLNCPDEFWYDVESCTETKDFIKDCSILKRISNSSEELDY